MKTKLWLLKLNDDLIDYNYNILHIIRSSTERKARIMASKISAGERRKGPNNSNPWTRNDCSSCVELVAEEVSLFKEHILFTYCKKE